jgi:hypothetical protein
MLQRLKSRVLLSPNDCVINNSGSSYDDFDFLGRKTKGMINLLPQTLNWQTCISHMGRHYWRMLFRRRLYWVKKSPRIHNCKMMINVRQYYYDQQLVNSFDRLSCGNK